MYEISLKSNKFCQLCDKELGYLDSVHKSYYRGDPKRANSWITRNPHRTLGEYRKRCLDCFYKEFGRIRVRPNVFSADMDWLLQVDTSEQRAAKANTLNNMIKRYGKAEGERKWKEYCEFHSVKNTFEYKQEKLGWTQEEFDEFNKSRAVTLELCIQRHGEAEGTKVFNDYCEKQAYAGTALEYFQEKYGTEEGLRIWTEANEAKSHTLDNFIKRYGEDEGPKLWAEYLDSVPSYYSKMSFKIFSEVSERLGESYNCRYGESEFGLYDTIERRYYKYDFCIHELKRIIEFNGSYWHADPSMYNESQIIKRPGGKTRVVGDVWEFDRKKNLCASRMGYEVLVIWESNYLNDKQGVIEKCLEFIRK